MEPCLAYLLSLQENLHRRSLLFFCLIAFNASLGSKTVNLVAPGDVGVIWKVYSSNMRIKRMSVCMKFPSCYWHRTPLMISVHWFKWWPSVNKSPQNDRHFVDNILKYISLNENVWISIKNKVIPQGSSSNIPALVQIMTWCWPADKPLSEPMMANLMTYIIVTGLKWVDPDLCCYMSSMFENGSLKNVKSTLCKRGLPEQKIKHFLRRENTINKNKVSSYC